MRCSFYRGVSKERVDHKLELKYFHFRYEIPESSEGCLLEFDDVLKSVGEFGSWQKTLFFLTCTLFVGQERVTNP